ncbi:MAG TPA: tail fiber domain-containing protein [Polyangia bacterium]|nr:tail fiber domain-containing protein [Polyangia bacterium]
MKIQLGARASSRWLSAILLLGCGGMLACSTSSPLGRDSGNGFGGTGGAGAGTGGRGSGGTATDGGRGGQDGGNPDQGGADCGCGAFAAYRLCCANRCVNPSNDPDNCGTCGVKCPTDQSFCDNGLCQPLSCNAGTTCDAGTCCGTSCCKAGQICCSPQGPIPGAPICHTPTADAPTCPAGCAPLCISDRDRKQAIRPADVDGVLARVAQLPIATWRYREEPTGVLHMGPMAQDFRAAFGLGDSDRTYYAVDAHGVSLAAIQALSRMVDEDQRRLRTLERMNQQLRERLDALESRGRGARPRRGD